MDVPKVAIPFSNCLSHTNLSLDSQQDHLVCFLGGSLLLGVTGGRGPVPPDVSSFTAVETDDFYVGASLIRTCVETYTATKTGLAPEVRPRSPFFQI